MPSDFLRKAAMLRDDGVQLEEIKCPETINGIRADFVLKNVYRCLLDERCSRYRVLPRNDEEKEVLESVKETVAAFRPECDGTIKTLLSGMETTAVGLHVSRVADELFCEGISWSRIVTFLVFVGELANSCGEIDAVYDVFSELLKEKTLTWIRRRGGWEGLSEQMNVRYARETEEYAGVVRRLLTEFPALARILKFSTKPHGYAFDLLNRVDWDMNYVCEKIRKQLKNYAGPYSRHRLNVSFVCAGHFTIKKCVRDGNMYLYGTRDCLPLDAVRETVTGRRDAAFPEIKIRYCECEFCGDFPATARCERLVSNPCRGPIHDVERGRVSKRKNRNRPWCRKKHRVFDGRYVRYSSPGDYLDKSEFLGLVYVHVYAKCYGGHMLGEVRDMTLLDENPSTVEEPTGCRRGKKFDSLFNLCKYSLLDSVPHDRLMRSGLPKPIRENFFKEKPFLLHAIRKPRIVREVDVEGVRAFRKVTVDVRNQLWNAWYLMDDWYQKASGIRNWYTHVRLGNVCKQCCSDRDDQWELFWWNPDFHYVCRDERLWCRKCLLTPMVDVENFRVH